MFSVSCITKVGTSLKVTVAVCIVPYLSSLFFIFIYFVVVVSLLALIF